MKSHPPIILASTSPFRKTLLEKLGLPFSCVSPNIEENRYKNEPAKDMVIRLATEKAQAVARKHPNAVIIGSDQCALHNNHVLGKPLTHDKAVRQLSSFSGEDVTFFTALAVYDPLSRQTLTAIDTTVVSFRSLSSQDIENYLALENALNCAGSFKSEGLGITLFKSLHTRDPNALIGLPLIELSNLLRNLGWQIPPPKQAL